MPTQKTIQLEIQKSVFGGDGLSRLDSKVFFVENALPGEIVEARITQEKKDWCKAKAVKIVKPSPKRVEPPCPHYGYCGGCQYQHASYLLELAMKEEQVREIFSKISEAKNRVSKIIHGKKDYGYRRSATFHVGEEGRGKKYLGYVSKDNVSLVKIQNCDLLNPDLAGMINIGARRAAPLPNRDKISFKVSKDGKLFSDEKEAFYPVVLLGKKLLVNSKGFFQNNWEVTELLAKKVADFVSRISPEVFYDLYAGVGTFTFLSAAGVPRIACIEESPYAVSALRMNCQNHSRKDIQVIEERVEKIFETKWSEEGGKKTIVFMDPPRQGISKKLADFLSETCDAKALVYVSCDPMTLARDLQLLLKHGRWRLEEIAPFDMFPRTKHIELAIFLSRLT